MGYFNHHTVQDLSVSNHTAQAVRATGTHTVADGTGTAEADITVGTEVEGDTVTIDCTLIGGPSVSFTFTATPTLDTDVEIGVDSDTTAANLSAAIELLANGLVPDYLASANAVAAVVTPVAAAEGRKGNAIALTETGSTVTLESANLSGGAGSAAQNDTATIGATVFTWRLIPTLSTHVAIGDTAEACAANLEAAVEAHATAGALVTGSTAGRVVTWQSILYGTTGHYALAESGDSTTVSAAAMAGGVNPLIAEPGSGRRIVILGYTLSLDANGELSFYSGATAKSGAMEVLADTPLCRDSEHGVLRCAVGEPFSMLATTACNGHIEYAIVSL
jgi:hypothetical protein